MSESRRLRQFAREGLPIAVSLGASAVSGAFEPDVAVEPGAEGGVGPRSGWPDLPSVRSGESVAILAGNSKVERAAGGELILHPQLHAFRAALRFAAALRDCTGKLPPVSIAFDHPGTFRKQFLAAGLTRSQKRHPMLADLCEDLRAVFGPIADACGVHEGAIEALHEDSAKTHVRHSVEAGSVPPIIAASMMRLPAPDSCARQASSAPPLHDEEDPVERATCRAITAEYFTRSARDRVSLLEVFIERSEWSRPQDYVAGVVLGLALGARIAVRLHLALPDGRVVSGAWSDARGLVP